MRHMTQISLLGAACLALAACGSSRPAPGVTGGGAVNNGNTTSGVSNGPVSNGNSTGLTLNLQLQSFLFDPNAGVMDPNSTLQVTVEDLATVFGGGKATPLATATVTQEQCPSIGSVAIACRMSVNNINPNTTDGLVILTTDSRVSSDQPRWQATYTVVPQSTIAAAQNANDALTVTAAVLTSDGLAQMALWSATSAATITSNGAFLSTISDKSGIVQGATLNTGAETYTVNYANGQETAVGDGSTSSAGLVLATSASNATRLSTDWTVAAPTGSKDTWTVPPIGTAPFAITVYNLIANP